MSSVGAATTSSGQQPSNASLALAGTSLFASALGAVQQEKAAKFQAGLHDFNARVAELNIDESKRQGRFQQRQLRETARRFKGRQRVAIGASGFAFSGQRNRLIAESARDAERDFQMSMRNFAVQQGQLTQQAAIERFRATDVRQAAKINTRATILNAGVNVGYSLLG